jgi:hypothetical protein
MEVFLFPSLFGMGIATLGLPTTVFSVFVCLLGFFGGAGV